jgi:hypothetical protein
MRKRCAQIDISLTHTIVADKFQDELFSRAIEKFVNVDGNLGRTVMPFPFNAHWNKDILQYSNLSVADRIAQISHDLSSDEQHAIEAFVLLCSGGTRDNSAFLDFLRWWAAGNYNYKTLLDTIIVFKLKCGQSGFAIKFFNEAVATGHFSYSFNTTVSRVDFSKGFVQVQTADGQKFQAKRLICTVPLNVLNKVEFNPPLDQAKQEAAVLKHVNQCVKVHAEIKDPEMRSWSGVTYPNNELVIGLADGRTPAGTTHCVFFGCNANLHADEDVAKTLNAVKAFAPMDVERLVSLSFTPK